MGTRVKKNLNHQKSANEPKKNSKIGHKSKEVTGSYRIIGGHWRSRRLSFPAIEGLRPTTDRVRETLFNWLASEIQGARVMDLFAGSGALGLEALSRGAGALFAIEKNKSAWRALTDNLNMLVTDESQRKNCSVKCTDALDFLSMTKAQIEQPDTKYTLRYDLIFLDPPFRQGLLAETLTLLDKHPLLEPSALIYIEQEKESSQLIPKNWQLLKEKIAGQVRYQLYRSGSLDPGE